MCVHSQNIRENQKVMVKGNTKTYPATVQQVLAPVDGMGTIVIQTDKAQGVAVSAHRVELATAA